MSLEDGLLAYKRGKYSEAIALLKKYCKQCQIDGSAGSRNYMQAGIALVKSYHAQRNIDKAIAYCEFFIADEKNQALSIWANQMFLKLQETKHKLEPEPKCDTDESASSTSQSQENIQLLDKGVRAQKQGNHEVAIQSLEAYLETSSNKRSRHYMQAQISRIKAYRSLGEVNKVYALCEELCASNNPALKSWAENVMLSLYPSGKASPESLKIAETEHRETPNHQDTSKSASQNHIASLDSQQTSIATPILRRTPIRPGVAQCIDNTSTVEISAAPVAPSSIPVSNPTRSNSTASSFHSIQRSEAPLDIRPTMSSQRTLSRSKTKGTGVAALLGGGTILVITRLLFRRGVVAFIAAAIAIVRACMGGNDFSSNQSYSDEAIYDELHLAACEGNVQETQTLIQSGKGVDVLDSEGNTPLFWAVSGCSYQDEVNPLTEGHHRVASMLMSNGASLNISNVYGETPLHWAAAWGNAEMTTALISQGANIHALDDYQSTPLHWSASWGNLPSTEALVNLGVPLSPQDNEGNTPLDLAKYNNENSEVVTFLQSRGATPINTVQ